MSNHRVKSRGGSAQLDRILSNNSGLQELALYGHERLEVLEGSQPYTTLQLESDWTDNNTGMLHLLRRCPSLTALVFSVNRCPATELALSVKKYCPDLQTITGVGSSRYDASYVRGLTEIEHVELIESIRSLVHYTMLIDDLPLSVCRALVGHANALTSIDLTFKGHTIEGLANLETVLGACRSLNVLRLSNAFDTWNEVDGAVMLRGVWGCLHLQHIEICGFVRPASGASMPIPLEAGEVLVHHGYEKASGWKAEVRGKGYERQDNALIVLKALFAKRDTLPILNKIAVDSVVYSKTSLRL